ncbi:hypothetical protein LX99_00645 [Mucilaginibacter oryzae]|uniref:Uncharacterized protein n=1 Tax=Mucilaginibacter oryzae TaxID=468058 RepID=A0A316HJG3_9SPHI|nr:hypothetical protein LX99_00645 [Mucilaginibacter oryzae]
MVIERAVLLHQEHNMPGIIKNTVWLGINGQCFLYYGWQHVYSGGAAG